MHVTEHLAKAQDTLFSFEIIPPPRGKSVRDIIDIVDNYPGFEVDSRKVSLKGSSSCPAYGIPRGCNHGSVGRYRRVPPWLKAGKALGLQCEIKDRGANCSGGGKLKTVTVGGSCDTQMRPVTRVP
mgnify:CR=1 FL=1